MTVSKRKKRKPIELFVPSENQPKRRGRKPGSKNKPKVIQENSVSEIKVQQKQEQEQDTVIESKIDITAPNLFTIHKNIIFNILSATSPNEQITQGMLFGLYLEGIKDNKLYFSLKKI